MVGHFVILKNAKMEYKMIKLNKFNVVKLKVNDVKFKVNDVKIDLKTL